eukprot:gb/GEZJ01004705.1/.p2 GENE.gb/GEZJ01004705.1/~~gb/GEZJ01004705.1/.p2  ORF type:complete len:436 (+),score=88.23 gb/GEZJ01004705.1/:111-1310(+)
MAPSTLRATFVAQPPLQCARQSYLTPRLTPRRARRPRVAPLAWRFRAVFLPPDGEQDADAADPADPDAEERRLGDLPDSLSASTSPPPPPPPPPPRPPPRGSLSNIDRLLEDTEPRYTTWQQDRASTSLSTFSYDRPFLGADELNESLKPSHLQRHRHVLAPDEQFAAVFMWDTVVYNARELEMRAWAVVAEENTLPPPDLQDIVRAEDMAPEAAVQRVFYWFAEWRDIKRYVFRKAEVYQHLCASYKFHAREGVLDWLRNLHQYGVKSILYSPHPRRFVMDVLQRIGLASFFTSADIVAADDECESLEQVFLLAAVKAQRPPSKCIVFTDRPSAVTAAHDVSAKVVALLGVHAAYEVKSADQTVADYQQLVLYNIRRLFSQQGAEFLDPRTELEIDRK